MGIDAGEGEEGTDGIIDATEPRPRHVPPAPRHARTRAVAGERATLHAPQNQSIKTGST